MADDSTTPHRGIAAPAYLGDGIALARTIFGHKLFVDTRDIGTAPHLLLEGVWELWGTRVFLDLVREGMTVVDVGANVGYYAVLGAWKVGPQGHVYAFEASPPLCDLLGRSLAANGFLDRVNVVNRAVWDGPGRLRFTTAPKHSGANRVVHPNPEAGRRFAADLDAISVEARIHERLQALQLDFQEIEIDALSLDEYFGERADTVHVMKIDVQGAEPFVFRGMRTLLDRNPQISIVCEFCPSMIMALGEDPRLFLEEVRGHGFTTRLIEPGGSPVEISAAEILGRETCDLLLRR